MPSDACTPLVINSETTSSMASASASRPHSHSTCLACSRAHGTALGSAPSSRYDRSGQESTARALTPARRQPDGDPAAARNQPGAAQSGPSHHHPVGAFRSQHVPVRVMLASSMDPHALNMQHADSDFAEDY